MKRFAAFFIVLLGVSACESVAGTAALVVLGADMTSIMYTDKALLDHSASAAIGQDCSLLYMEEKKPYCRDWAGQDESSVVLYCYPTLGKPECYVNPLPDRQGRYSLAVPNPET